VRGGPLARRRSILGPTGSHARPARDVHGCPAPSLIKGPSQVEAALILHHGVDVTIDGICPRRIEEAGSQAGPFLAVPHNGPRCVAVTLAELPLSADDQSIAILTEYLDLGRVTVAKGVPVQPVSAGIPQPLQSARKNPSTRRALDPPAGTTDNEPSHGQGSPDRGAGDRTMAARGTNA
jgi:hypothetical protein